MSSRELDDWLSAYLKYVENTEPPVIYHTWVGLSCLAGALQRKTYIKWGYDTIYPNMYVVLVGPSGRARKGTAIGLGQDLLNNIGISMSSESITREALIRDMKESVNSFTDPDDYKIKFHCSFTAISEELSVFLGQNDIKFLADLTNWYDSRDKWTYRTKGAGTDQIQGVCFNLLGATAPDWLQSILPQEAIGGGFTSRIIFVVAENKGKTVAEDVTSPDRERIRKKLINDLERIATISGKMTFDPDAYQAYVRWYEKHDASILKGEFPIDDPRFSGYLDRRATHIRKLCMLLSASRADDKIITEEDFYKADKLLRDVELEMPKTFGGLGRAHNSDVFEKVLRYIEKNKRVYKSTLMRSFYRDLDYQSLEVIETTMLQMKVVKRIIDSNSGETIYEWLG